MKLMSTQKNLCLRAYEDKSSLVSPFFMVYEVLVTFNCIKVVHLIVLSGVIITLH